MRRFAVFRLSILHAATATSMMAMTLTMLRAVSEMMTEAATAVTRAAAVRNTESASEPLRPAKKPLAISLNIATEGGVVKCSSLEDYVDMDIIAHRGYSGAYPENTMLAFRKAAACGADGIELDVHLSRDGEVMIIHDEALVRTTGRPGSVSDYTRSELEAINARNTMGPDGPFTPIPSLEEYLDFISGTDLYTNIELKTAPVYYPGIEEKTLSLVRRFGLESRIIFSSFNWLSVFRIKKLAPEIPAGLLYEGAAIRNMGAAMNGMGIECYHPSFSLLSDEAVAELQGEGIRINAWTVNSRSDMLQCHRWHLDSIITNEPEEAGKLFSA